jgi:hypothetical protein
MISGAQSPNENAEPILPLLGASTELLKQFAEAEIVRRLLD